MPGSHRIASRRPRRFGFTLVEFLLVLAVMVLVAAMSVPILQRSFSGQRLKNSGDRVRAEFGRARVKAIESGQVYAFFFIPGAGQFSVAPFEDDLMSQIDVTPDDLRTSNFDFARNTLPKGIIFAAGDIEVDVRAQMVSEEANVDLNQRRAVLFYPDGTCQDAKIYLQDTNDGAVVRVQVRDLTGMSTVSGIMDPQELK